MRESAVGTVHAVAAAAAVLLLIGCENDPASPTPVAADSQTSLAASGSGAHAASTGLLQAGPPAASAAASAHQAAALALLSGGQAGRLPLRATDDGKAFDPNLPRKLAPLRPGRGARVRAGDIKAAGRLPPEVIQRIVRQNYGRIRLCYDKARDAKPTLKGKITMRFVIGTDGKVNSVAADSNLNDKPLDQCVSDAFRSLTFPQPEGGIVTVSYPITFEPPE